MKTIEYMFEIHDKKLSKVGTELSLWFEYKNDKVVAFKNRW